MMYRKFMHSAYPECLTIFGNSILLLKSWIWLNGSPLLNIRNICYALVWIHIVSFPLAYWYRSSLPPLNERVSVYVCIHVNGIFRFHVCPIVSCNILSGSVHIGEYHWVSKNINRSEINPYGPCPSSIDSICVTLQHISCAYILHFLCLILKINNTSNIILN